ncbi:MAG: hypothetical protein DMF00_06755 [Verrucomicrobia bacterium]|nr:MAG: hypothetical protein DMF00_06755 [Verrucomicrobiota bacterium]
MELFLRRRLTDFARCTLVSNKERSTTEFTGAPYSSGPIAQGSSVDIENASTLRALITQRVITIVTATNDQRQ